MQGTPYSNRISVNGTAATRELVLTINDVQLEDEVGFICLIKSVTEGDGEGRTSLKVFGKIPLHFKPVFPPQAIFRFILLYSPAFPLIYPHFKLNVLFLHHGFAVFIMWYDWIQLKRNHSSLLLCWQKLYLVCFWYHLSFNRVALMIKGS